MINSSSKKFLTDDVLKTVEIIKKESDIDNTSDATKTNYKAEIRRTLAKLNARGKKNAADFLAVLAETRSKATYYRRLAATNYFLRSNISTLMAKLDAATEEADIANTCRSIEYFAAIKKLIADNVGQCPVINAKARASKRTMLGSLSKDGDFREKLYKHLEGSHYQIPFLVAAVSGARPQELQNGIQIYVKDGRLVMTIAGSKVKKSQGQDIRVIEYAIGTETCHFLVAELVRLLGPEAKQGLKISVNSKVNFTSALRRAGKALWPKKRDITPYVLRHAISSQWKQDLHPDEVSIALGHTSAKTRTRYGQAQLMRGAGNLTPASVRGTSPIRSLPQARSRNIR